MHGKLMLLVVSCGLLSVATPAFAQGFQGNQYGRGADPNLGHFYMGRQEIQYLDDAPVVQDMRTNPAAAQQGRAPVAARPQPLPRAGFMPYSSSIPSMSNSLPKVVNGVPPKAPPPVAQNQNIDPRMAKAGKYKPPKAAAPPRSTVAKSYAPYKGYGGPNGGGGPSSGGGMPSNSGVSTGVTGRLHWSRTGH